ncbi:MAG: peroxiredoxin [Sphaerochaetaceae bacterium]|jgi:peroxiredoxin Q/BCP|nr:peroxiredoxin [Sphaerochaetaceae bacterium]HHU88598.1 peroxiredoxin [Spirochaetales bacterium]
MVNIGDKIPSIELKDDQDNLVNFDSLLGHYVILYAYPRNNTPGCTAEACSFRDNSRAITAQGALILGISPDSVTSHQKFKEKYNLNFTLLSDPDHLLLEALGAWGEKKSFGQTRMGVIRSTYLFDKEGKLLKKWPKVSPQEHGKEIAAYLEEIKGK